ncbi:MAG: SDR family oxidoreductase, partial [Acetobacterales bacterium]
DRRVFGEVNLAGLHAAERLVLDGFFNLATAALPWLEKSGWGRVVAVSSFVVHVTGSKGDLFPVSAAAKAGVEALARSLAFQIAATGTTVNCVAPGYTRKDAAGHSALSQDSWKAAEAIIPMGRLGRPDDTAGVIAFLLSRDAAYVTGQTVHVDGGLTLP